MGTVIFIVFLIWFLSSIFDELHMSKTALYLALGFFFLCCMTKPNKNKRQGTKKPETTRYHFSRRKVRNELQFVDRMSGRDFEFWCATLLRENGYHSVQVTPLSGDQGADILATRTGLRYAIQCKCYSKKLGNKPIQEVVSARSFYGCDRAMVITNSYFTKGGVEAADANDVILVDRDMLAEKI